MTWSRAHGSKAGNQAPYLAQPPSCRPPTLQAAKTGVFAQKCAKCVPFWPTMQLKAHVAKQNPGRDSSSTAFNIAFRNRVRTSCVFMRRCSAHADVFLARLRAPDQSLRPRNQAAESTATHFVQHAFSRNRPSPFRRSLRQKGRESLHGLSNENNPPRGTNCEMSPTAQDTSAARAQFQGPNADRHPRTSRTACNHLRPLGRPRRRARHRESRGRTSRPFGRRRS